MSISTDSAPKVIIVMGVSGCGKSTIAELIAQRLQGHFKDGDELHPKENIVRMESGIPLTDTDRQPWLEQVAQYAHKHAQQFGLCVIACSALKKHYREQLDQAGNVYYVFLKGSQSLIAQRMQQRSGHFMPTSLLESQFAALESPEHEARVVTVSIDHEPEEIAQNAVNALRASSYL